MSLHSTLNLASNTANAMKSALAAMGSMTGAVSRCPFAHQMRASSTKAMDLKVELRDAVDHAESRCPFLKNNEGILSAGSKGINSTVAPGPLRTLARQCPVMSTAIRDVTGTGTLLHRWCTQAPSSACTAHTRWGRSSGRRPACPRTCSPLLAQAGFVHGRRCPASHDSPFACECGFVLCLFLLGQL